MYTTRDVYGNPRFIIHFLDLVHEDHPGDHCDKMESARRMANKHGGRKYRGRVFGGGFVFQVYGLDLLIDELYNDIYKKATTTTRPTTATSSILGSRNANEPHFSRAS